MKYTEILENMGADDVNKVRGTATALTPRGVHSPADPIAMKYLFTEIALRAARKETVEGLIWIKVRNRWKIVGNYDGKGGVWNGEDSRIVPATVEDLMYLAHNKG